MDFIGQKRSEAIWRQDNIRNVSVIGSFYHGKSTLTDSLVAKAGIIPMNQVGTNKFTDNRQDEKLRGISIKSTSLNLFFDEYQENQEGTQTYTVNLIDSPGHVDFCYEAISSLRLTDGVLLVVDCIEGVCMQTEILLKQALKQRVKPILVINKIERCFLELQQDAEKIYQGFKKIIQQVNSVISIYDDGSMGDVFLDPWKGNIIFGSGLMGWGFTIKNFAAIYSKKLGVNSQKLTEKLWGEWYFNFQDKKWMRNPYSETPFKRAFNSFVIEPIQRMIKDVMQKDQKKISKILNSLLITIEDQDWELTGKKLLKKIMQKWLNLGDCLFQTIVNYLPSPRLSQRYRVESLYKGPLNDEAAQGIRNCDPDSPLILQVCKMLPSPLQKGVFISVGRVFAGSIHQGSIVKIMGPKYQIGRKDDLFVKPVQNLVMIVGDQFKVVTDVPCGNIVGLVGLDQFINKTATISSQKVDSYPIKPLHFPTLPIIQIPLLPKNPVQLPQLVQGLRKLFKFDLLVQCSWLESGENIISSCGELHTQICLNDLQEFSSGIVAIRSDPIISYRQTVLSKSSQVCLAKSPNKHNRIYTTAQPISEELICNIQKGQIEGINQQESRSRTISSYFGQDFIDSTNFWAFGPDNSGPNLLVNQIEGKSYIEEIRQGLQVGFQQITQLGCLAEENMRGVRFNIQYTALNPQAVSRGLGQIIATAKRAFFGAFLTAQPVLQEPIYLVEIWCPSNSIQEVYQILESKRGLVINEEAVLDDYLSIVKAYLPVAESFGFNDSLRMQSQGLGISQNMFDHWKIVQGDLYDENSYAYQMVMEIRRRKGLICEIPHSENFLDYV